VISLGEVIVLLCVGATLAAMLLGIQYVVWFDLPPWLIDFMQYDDEDHEPW
jgi:hypothetical protein